MEERAKHAYLSYNSMITKIQEGIIDAYDVIYCTDTKENYVVSPELVPWAVKSRIYTFDSISEANNKLNQSTDTYVGQIVSILSGDKYVGYVVNKLNDLFVVNTICAQGDIDYNTIGNRPIENLIGTFENTIIVDMLPTGIYKIKGQYKISEYEETVYLSSDGDLFLVETNDIEKYIKRFTKDSIYDFIVTDGNIKKNIYVTDKYLEDCEYVTKNEMAALEETMKRYTQSYVEDFIGNTLNSKIDARINEKIEAIADEEVNNLF